MKSPETERDLFDLLACMRALQHIHHTAHWIMKGEPFYGDHLLFERLYTNLTDEFDVLAEKAVAYFDEDTVDPVDQAAVMRDFVEQWDDVTDCPVKRSLYAEKHLLSILEAVYEDISARDDMTLGLDDYIMALANSHETHLYLIQQKVRCECDAH